MTSINAQEWTHRIPWHVRARVLAGIEQAIDAKRAELRSLTEETARLDVLVQERQRHLRKAYPTRADMVRERDVRIRDLRASGLGADEIAAFFGIHENSVYNSLRRSSQALPRKDDSVMPLYREIAVASKAGSSTTALAKQFHVSRSTVRRALMITGQPTDRRTA